MVADVPRAAGVMPRPGAGGSELWQALSPAQRVTQPGHLPPDEPREEPQRRISLLRGLGVSVQFLGPCVCGGDTWGGCWGALRTKDGDEKACSSILHSHHGEAARGPEAVGTTLCPQHRSQGLPHRTRIRPLPVPSLPPPSKPRGHWRGHRWQDKYFLPAAFGRSGPSSQTPQEPISASWSGAPMSSSRARPLMGLTARCPGLPHRHRSAARVPRGIPGLCSQGPSPGDAQVLVSVLGGCLCE